MLIKIRVGEKKEKRGKEIIIAPEHEIIDLLQNARELMLGYSCTKIPGGYEYEIELDGKKLLKTIMKILGSQEK